MCKEPPDLDLILLFVIAANVENRQYEIHLKKKKKKKKLMLGPSPLAFVCKISHDRKPQMNMQI